MEIKTRVKSAFIRCAIIFFVLTFINCLLTASPYSAWHSGKVGSYSNGTRFFFNNAYILVFSMLISWLFSMRVYKKNIGYILCVIIAFSGVLNGGIFSDFNTYLFDIISLFLVSSLAINDAASNYQCFWKSCERYDNEYDLFLRIVELMMISGLIMALFGKGRFGFLTFSISRQSRGEVTLWVMLFIPVMLVSMLMINKLRNNRNRFLFLATIIVVLFTLTTSSRTQILLFSICIVLYWIGLEMNIKKLMLLVLTVIISIFFYDVISQFFFLGESSINSATISAILNGRLELWLYYWDVFKSNWLLGVGPSVMTETARNTISASSEIGILKNATCYGALFGIIEIYMILRGVKASLMILKNQKLYSKYDLFIVFMFVCSITVIFQQHARILNFSDLICWYSFFYLYYIEIKGQNNRNDIEE